MARNKIFENQLITKLSILVLALFFINGKIADKIGVNSSFYVNSISGNDSNNGKSPATAWKTISRIKTSTFNPGDSILLNGSQTFFGEINLTVSGTPGHPITIGSYGNGKATINAGNSNGIHWVNSSFAVVKNLIIKGNGASNRGNGVFFENKSGIVKKSILVDNVEAYGFGFTSDHNFGLGNGIAVTGSSAFDSITIQNCVCHGNQSNGISVIAKKSVHTLIQDCITNDNEGNSDFKKNWSGSGIFVYNSNGAIVQRCVANSNGSRNGCAWGPVGIIVGGNNIVVQNCVACDNQDPSKADGGGYDIDVGDNCIIQYCYSKNNVGPGFMINPAAGGLERSASNCIIRYNISENDCTSNGYGAMLFGPFAGGKMTNMQCYNNVVYKPGGKVFSADNDALSSSDLKVFNNIFVGSSADWNQYLYGNNCYSGGITSPAADATPVNADPSFVNPGAGGDGFKSFDGYKLQPGSPCINAGTIISNNGGKDFWGNTFTNGKPNIGANK